jgi:SAM-dependent methyltransferase
MSWSHGYNVSSGYTYGFYREMAPDWLNYAALLHGYRVPDASGAFRYLELGCGQGFGLCLLAASYPQAEFLGIDFNPEHIAHARELAQQAGLDNVRFEEADFAVLAQQWPADYGKFQYAVLHGIYSWVPVPLRAALVQVLERATTPGALVYNSYNTLPGWLSAVPLQHMLRRLQQQSAQSGPQVIRQGVELFDQLIAANAVVAQAQPPLKVRLESIKTQNPSYLVQEYLHENWHPLWFSQVAEELGGAKLNYVATATLPENYLPGVLQPALRDIVRTGEGEIMQQELIDLAINQSFRRDIYCRGPRATQRSLDLLEPFVLLASATMSAEVREVSSAAGNLSLNSDLITLMADALAQGPCSLAELIRLAVPQGHTRQNVIQIATMLLHAGHVSLGTAQTSDASVARLNRVIANAVTADLAPYGALAARGSAAALTAGVVEMALYRRLAEGATVDLESLATVLREDLLATGRTILKEGAVLQDADAQLAQSRVLVSTFIAQTLPVWRRLGVL